MTTEQEYVKLPLNFFQNPRLMMLMSDKKAEGAPKNDSQALSVYMQLAMAAVKFGGRIAYTDGEIAAFLLGKGLSERRVTRIIACLIHHGLAWRDEDGALVVLEFTKDAEEAERER